jgi:hypothetical protein
MMRSASFLTPPVVMGSVAALAGLLAIVAISRPGTSNQARYAKRIIGTMLTAAAIILSGFACALSNWETGA